MQQLVAQDPFKGTETIVRNSQRKPAQQSVLSIDEDVRPAMKDFLGNAWQAPI